MATAHDVTYITADGGYAAVEVANRDILGNVISTYYAPKSDTYTKSEVDAKVSSAVRYKGSVATYADLPASGQSVGDMYNVAGAYGNTPAGTNWAWNGTEWDPLAGIVDLSPYATNSYVNGTFLTISNASSTYVPKATTVNGHALSGNVSVTKSDVGLGNVDNTSDADKPVSTATQEALTGKLNASVLSDSTATFAGTSAKATTIVNNVTSGSYVNIIYGLMADNDYYRLRAGGNSNSGEIALETADDGNEPISVAQYNGVFGVEKRRAYLLDGSGNTSFPGTVTAGSFTGRGTGLTGSASGLSVGGSSASCTGNAATATLAAKATADANGNEITATYVPQATTVNGHALSGNITVSKSDVGLGRVENYYSTGDITDDTAYLLSGAVYNGTLCYYENTDRGLGFGFFPHYENLNPEQNGNILGLSTNSPESESAYTAVLLDSNTGGKPRLRFYYGDAKYSMYKETIIDGDGIHFYVGNTPFVEGATFDSELLYGAMCKTGDPVVITWDSVRHFVYPLLTSDGEMCSTTVAYRDGSGNLITNYYQPKLVSGTNIKTINGTSVLGSGNITVSGGGNIRSNYSTAYIGSSSTTIQVTLSPSMPDTNYSVAVTSRDSSTTASFSVYDKSTTGFKIKVQFSGTIMGTASIDYIVVANT